MSQICDKQARKSEIAEGGGDVCARNNKRRIRDKRDTTRGRGGVHVAVTGKQKPEAR